MGKPMNDLKELEAEFGFIEVTPCSKEDTEKYGKMLKNGEPLPENVVARPAPERGKNAFDFYDSTDVGLSEEQKTERYRLQKLKLMKETLRAQYLSANATKTIATCCLFLTVVAAIGLILVFADLLISRFL